jgi:hypothetical protein
MPGGTVECVIPHFSNPYFYSDPTHQRFFGLYSLSYLCRDRIFSRKVPHYGKPVGFSIETVDLHFRSPFPIRNKLRRLFGLFVNVSNFTKEFYEENLSSLVSCYEIRWILRKEAVSA